MILEEYKTPITDLKNAVSEIWGRLDPAAVKEKIAEKEEFSASPGFWNDTKKAEKVMSEIKALKNTIEPWESLMKQIEDMEALYELAEESKDESLVGEIDTALSEIQEKYEKLNILNLLSDEVDKNGSFITIHAGAGGTEACDWAQMLSRMYVRWAERHGFKVETVDMLEAEGGIKSVTHQITGDYAFGYLKGEAGVHRLVRISPFDSNARRHTSFTSVFVFPILDDSIEIDIRPEDLRVDTYRSGGAGGQHVNKTDSAVRFTHLPTGIVVACQTERSQIMNRQTAMSILKARLYEYYREKKEQENQKFAAEKKDISWGNQIRSYVFQPYTMVKDHRTRHETGNIQAVMDGDIDPFIEAYLNNKWQGAVMDKDDADL
ncbi:peptide chain release factor 2 [Brucepastera parasyntrophica]|uniref:peptide chain release factor 2 n=1 Tax=Brucepastera parasyntrophica TaxID=2880008 RepID=UPI00210A6C7A|nr:peptide chain release factor 2 [Brucepastera parasyntrophica]ULQ59929.1 peptide chain release factor 2 [Brucepastera parasyntrophica]